MPTYMYTSQAAGLTVERFYPVGKAPKKIRVETQPGVLRVFYRDIAAEHSGAKAGPLTCWPKLSTALGVNPDEIKDARQYAAERGVMVDFHPGDGRAIIRDRKHFKECCRAFGRFNKDAGYGDAAPTT